MEETIFLTGSTGLLGSYLLKKLLEYKVGSIIALSRSKTQEAAKERVFRELGKHLSAEQKRMFFPLIKVVRGDITEKNLGLSENTYTDLAKEITWIYHSAALCRFNAPLSIIRKVNVKGTENILKLALLCKENGRLKRFNHISTVGVAGDSEELFYEKDLDIGQKFNNTYEQSKFEAEKLIVKYRKRGLPITIYRPAVITGDYYSGYTNNFEMIYRPLQIFFTEMFNEIPADKSASFPFAPVDYVAEAIVRISLDNDSCASVYHLTGYEITFDKFLDSASKYFKFQKPLFIPIGKFDFENLSPFQLRIIKPYISYLNYKLRFDSKNAQVVLNKTGFRWPKISNAFLRRLFKFCIQSKFIVPREKPSLKTLFSTLDKE